MEKLNIAIIGQGRSGRNIHGKHLKSENNTLFNVVAVVDRDQLRRERALEDSTVVILPLFFRIGTQFYSVQQFTR